jgi:hypothetical protein|tara:strand:- start:68 stop:730 length:663 start_codon:yes stop_codon:yes gene_type:complete
MQEKVDISIFNWGPCVIKLKITDEFKNLLLAEGEKSKIDFSKKLAGIIDKEIGYTDESRNKIVPYLSQYLGVYNKAYERYVNKPFDKNPEYILTSLWINYQKANDYNPPHDHDGKLSFVTYLKIPEELTKENKDYQGKSCGPGGIQFIYGNGPRDCITYMSFMPEENDIFIFPAWLKHYVAPYKSDVTRVSVSGNIHDSAPLNAIQGFAPEYLKGKNEKK